MFRTNLTPIFFIRRSNLGTRGVRPFRWLCLYLYLLMNNNIVRCILLFCSFLIFRKPLLIIILLYKKITSVLCGSCLSHFPSYSPHTLKLKIFQNYYHVKRVKTSFRCILEWFSYPSPNQFDCYVPNKRNRKKRG